MTIAIKPHCFSGSVRVPASKSHTIRRLFIAAMADGISEILHPLDSLDVRSCVSVCRALGAEISELRVIDPDSPNPADENSKKLVSWIVKGSDMLKNDKVSSINISNNSDNNDSDNDAENEIKFCDVGNSGTTLFMGLAIAALGKGPVKFDGDEQIRRRSAGPLLEALTGLGVKVESSPDGCAPITIRGPWRGGRVSLSCPLSQYLSALLIAAPMAPFGTVTEIDVQLLNERPYVEMTLFYLKSHGLQYEAALDFSCFRIPGQRLGGQRPVWKPMSAAVPGDFSSAAFPAAAAVISRGNVTLLGLDPDDSQGDKVFFHHLEKMGCLVSWEKAVNGWALHVSCGASLKGGEFGLNDTPDLLPVMAAVACFAQGDTALLNVAHARMKETDRIAGVAEELAKLGVKTTERPDGLIVHGSGKPPAKAVKLTLDGREDHRVIMALACIALGCQRPVEISGVKNVNVSYPGFFDLIN